MISRIASKKSEEARVQLPEGLGVFVFVGLTVGETPLIGVFVGLAVEETPLVGVLDGAGVDVEFPR